MKKIVLHIADKGFQQIRYYGFYLNKFKNKITNKYLFTRKELAKMRLLTYWSNGLKKAFGYTPLLCKCGSYMILNPKLSFYNHRGGFT